MIIKDHCKPGGWRNPDGWQPQCAWNSSTTIQWGGNPERGFFFESYPPGTFITGHGKTLVEAELDAFTLYQKYQACPKHEFERRDYTNGVGFCKHCDMFKSKAFEPIEYCCKCNDPHGYSRDKLDRWWCKKCYVSMPDELIPDSMKRFREMDKEEPLTDEDFTESLDTVIKHIMGTKNES